MALVRNAAWYSKKIWGIKRSLGPILMLLIGTLAFQGCADTAYRQQILALQPLPRQRFVLQPKLLEALIHQQASQMTAYSWTPTGGLIELRLHRTEQDEHVATNISAEIPQICAREPILIRFRTQGQVRQILLEPVGMSGSHETKVYLPDAQTTFVAQIYAAARAASIWPGKTSYHALEYFVSDALARLLLRMDNQERMLAALTPGFVAAVQARQVVATSGLPHRLRSQSMLAQTTPTAIGSNIWSELALQQAQQAAACIDCGPGQVQTALASAAGFAALNVYLDKLPLDLRIQMRIELQRTRVRLVEKMLSSHALLLPMQAHLDAKTLFDQTLDGLSEHAESLPHAYVQQRIASAWSTYAATLVAAADKAHPDLASLWAKRTDKIHIELKHLKSAYAHINSRVAPQQTGEQLAQAYLGYLQSMQQTDKVMLESTVASQYFDLRANQLLLAQ